MPSPCSCASDPSYPIRRSRSVLHASSLVVLGLTAVLAGCGSRVSSPGDSFRVQMSLTSDTCGARGAPVPLSVEFRAVLTTTGQSASWRVDSSNIRAAGLFDKDSNVFLFENESSIVVRGVDRVNLRAACVLRRVDTIRGTLTRLLTDGGVSDVADARTDGGALNSASFLAVETVLYGVEPGADCSDLVGVSQGQFLALPCQQTFALRGAN